ncbi:hypothetical protein HDA36_004380 [Nocardiopsis composta]|uniref:Uncharacterized protein n=1 Tax=Nocardiopsis composta TaxID=157465 RepID=A0A7W8QPX6_9ACTN|nr:hypothetical protein [Nocardiopsis composta]
MRRPPLRRRPRSRSRVRRYARPAPAASLAGRWPTVRAGYGRPFTVRSVSAAMMVPA